MHAPSLENPRPTRHHPNGGSNWNFDNEAVQSRLLLWQENRDPQLMEEVLMMSRPHIVQMLRSYRELGYEETTNSALAKLWKSAHLYNPERGTAFSFVSRVAATTACNVLGELRRLRDRYRAMETDYWDSLAAPGFDSYGVVDFREKIYAELKSRRRLQCERSAQKWLVASGIDSAFVLRRFEVANAMMKVYGLGHLQSRELYDETQLELRRLFLSERTIRPVEPQDLLHTKGRAFIRFAAYLDSEQFSCLITLMKDLAPRLILLAKPSNIGAISRGEADAIRENLGLILNGDPDAKQLFAEGSLSTAIGRWAEA